MNMAGLSLSRITQCSRSLCGISAVLLALIVTNRSNALEADGSNVLTVADTNWTLIMQGEWMIKFYAPWCPACQHLQTDWENLGGQSKSLGISVGRVDVTQEPGLSGRFLVTTLPTIFHAKDGEFRKYVSSRTIEEIQAYVVNRKWTTVEPVSGWKSPSSLLMSGMATLFRLSVWIRQIHTYLTNTLGIPSWGSYVIFTIITLFMGLVLGLMLVLIADCIWPSRHKRREEKNVVILREEVSEEEVEEKHMSDLESEGERDGEQEDEKQNGNDQEKEKERETHDSTEDEEQSEESSLRRRRAHETSTTEGS
ncbi:hypothetical protein DNTS_028181 [Danionella cerebrum]|uniref:Thioredoxin domain-containing protein n=1 Tax=Danionella cerebrum TaxID=2873325 RepID=A0A553QR88_9TELE|nr:hypothetical protein DNTS_028181 [Danionella translucida]